ncbi:MAG: hypothetical protein FWD53_08495 [Phycisphaerales bacterium]|nr:hypothetical protein [Phycisphaerales bacterium]
MPSTQLLAVSHQTLAIVFGVGFGLMIVIYLALRFWFVPSRSSAKHIPTPNLDRLGRRALERMHDENADEEDEDEDSPEDLKDVVPKDEQ